MNDSSKRYWLFIIGGVFMIIVVTIFLMIFTSKPQEGGFIYQIN